MKFNIKLPNVRLKKTSLLCTVLVALFFACALLFQSPTMATVFVNFKRNIYVQYIPWGLTDNQRDACQISFGDNEYLQLKFTVDEEGQETVMVQKKGERMVKGYVTFDNDKPALPLEKWSIDELYDIKNYQTINVHAYNDTFKYEEKTQIMLAGASIGIDQFQQCVQEIKTKG